MPLESVRRTLASSSEAGNDTQPWTVGFYLVPEFPMMAFAAAAEPLRSANRLSGARHFDWRLYSRDGKPVRASNGIDVPVAGSLVETRDVDLLMVCAGSQGASDAGEAKMLRRIAQGGAAIGGISLGAYPLARAGLLDGKRCALHWENLAAFAEEFPRVRTTNDIFAIDGDCYTCSGGTAALDMMLQVVTARQGAALANAVSEQFIHPQIRTAHDPQRMTIQARLGVGNAKLIAAVSIMENAIDEPRAVQDIAAAVELSPRQLERLFARYLGERPRDHYLKLRLARARTLLRETTRPILDVAVASGFASASHFSRLYREAHGHRPSDERVPRRQGGKR